MVIIALAIILFIVGFVFKKHPGMAILSSVAGFSIYSAIAPQFEIFLRQIVKNGPTDLILSGFFLFLTAVAPLLIYLKAAGGLTGFNRAVAAIILALFIAILASPALIPHVKFDTVSAGIWKNIDQFKGWILLVGFIIAYIDILFTKNKIK